MLMHYLVDFVFVAGEELGEVADDEQALHLLHVMGLRKMVSILTTERFACSGYWT